jgi:transposase
VSANKRQRVRPTHEWELLLPLFEWPERERYEEIRPLVLFDTSVAERAAEVGTSASTLYRRLDRFAEEGMESLFDAPTARRGRLPPAVRRLIVDLKAEYPAPNLNEIANVVRAAFGRKPGVRSVGCVLSEEPLPLKIVRNYPPTTKPGRSGGPGPPLSRCAWTAGALRPYPATSRSTIRPSTGLWRAGKKAGSRA